MKKTIGLIVSFSVVLFVCAYFFASPKSYVEEKQTDEKAFIDYSDNSTLKNLADSTKISNDTLFLGIRMGMTKSEYRSFIHKLRGKGYDLRWQKSYKIGNGLVAMEVTRGVYVYVPKKIRHTQDGVTKESNGMFILDPYYNDDGKLIKFVVLGYGSNMYVVRSFMREEVRVGSYVGHNKTNLTEFLKSSGIIAKTEEVLSIEDDIVITCDDSFTAWMLSYYDLHGVYENVINKRMNTSKDGLEVIN